jgi:hypothetical protein
MPCWTNDEERKEYFRKYYHKYKSSDKFKDTRSNIQQREQIKRFIKRLDNSDPYVRDAVIKHFLTNISF